MGFTIFIGDSLSKTPPKEKPFDFKLKEFFLPQDAREAFQKF